MKNGQTANVKARRNQMQSKGISLTFSEQKHAKKDFVSWKVSRKQTQFNVLIFIGRCRKVVTLNHCVQVL